MVGSGREAVNSWQQEVSTKYLLLTASRRLLPNSLCLLIRFLFIFLEFFFQILEELLG
jgi:hypothetical protein